MVECPNCGYINDDERVVCIVCGALLPSYVLGDEDEDDYWIMFGSDF